jgi:hypothetical protein
MRQAVICMSLIGSFIVFALTIDLLNSIFMFLLFGILPGREEPLSANHMLAIYALATVFVFAYATRTTVQSLLRPAPKRQTRGSAS